MKVLTHISGSYVFVTAENGNHYLDARKDVRFPTCSFIELVRGGRVYRRETVPNTIAPERIIQLLREKFA